MWRHGPRAGGLPWVGCPSPFGRRGPSRRPRVTWRRGDRTHSWIIPVGRRISILSASHGTISGWIRHSDGAAAEAGGGVSTSAAVEGGASAPAGVDRRTFGRNRSPSLVLTMFGGGADREWEDGNGTKGEERAG